MIRTLRVISQDAVFWVVVPLLLILLPHFQRLPLWMSTTVVTLLIWRLLAIAKPALMPPKWLLLMIVVCTAIPALLSYGTLFGKNAGTAILTILLGIKLLESRQRRDYMLVIALSFFVIVTNFLFSQTIPTGIYMLLTVLVLVMSLIYINQDEAPLTLKQRFRLASKLLMQSLPLMLVLFLLFPRIPGPLWKLPDDAQSARTGLDDSMTPGNIARLVESDEVAFRVKFAGPLPPQDQLYWRALVLWYFDGRGWEPGKHNTNPWPTMEGFGQPVTYTITLEPHDRNWLFALDMPASAPASARFNNNYELRANDKVTALRQYQLESYLDYRIQHTLSPWEHSAGLKLPANSNPRSIALGQQWRQQFASPEEVIKQALQTFNRQNYVYTLRPPTTPGFDPVDQFMFDTQKGFCEHYASAFTVLMRAAGIPARVVLGYQGGNLNPVNDYLTVRQNDAHAWSEVWLEGRGWVRIDPTAAIAPERVERSLDAALAENAFRPLYMRMDVGPWKQLGYYWDALDNRWKQWVIGYDTSRQQRLLSDWLDRQLQYGDIILLLVIATGLVVLVISLFIFRPVAKQVDDPYQRLYNRFCRKLARGGLPRPSHQGPQAYAEEAMERFPRQRELIRLITGLYINARFRSRESQQQLRQMRKLVRQLQLFPRS